MAQGVGIRVQPAGVVGQGAVSHAARRPLRRRDMQHVEGFFALLAVAVRIGVHEPGFTGAGVHRFQGAVEVQPHLIAAHVFHQRRHEGFHPEQYAAGVVEPHVDIAQAMLSAPVVTGQIERLLRRAGAFDRHRRLCEQGAALAQVAYALPGVGRVFEQVIGGDAVAAQPVAQTLHAVQMQLQARGGHQHAVADPAAVVQHHLILFRHEGFHP